MCPHTKASRCLHAVEQGIDGYPLACVQKAAMATMLKACGSLNNKDIAPFVPVLVSCLAKPSEVPDCVHKLAATTFVQVSPQLHPCMLKYSIASLST